MSRFRDASEAHIASIAGRRTASASRDLVRALVAADRARRVTGGRFDPRVVDALERIGYGGVSRERPLRIALTPARVRGSWNVAAGTDPVALALPVDLGGNR